VSHAEEAIALLAAGEQVLEYLNATVDDLGQVDPYQPETQRRGHEAAESQTKVPCPEVPLVVPPPKKSRWSEGPRGWGLSRIVRKCLTPVNHARIG
jgi:hypothetical protein